MPQINSNNQVIFNVPQKIGNPTSNGLNTSQIIQEIQSATSLQLLNEGERLLLSAIYGTGIQKAIANEKLIQANRSNPFAIAQGFDPNSLLNQDARPDGNGGFIKTPNWGGYMSSSLSGMPVMCRLKFVGNSYTDYDGTIVVVPDIIFETVLISLKLNKNIKKTNITGRRNQGSVKENSGNGDWNVNIRAVITQSAPLNSQIGGGIQDGIYPIDNMIALSELIQANITFKVECWYLNKIAKINYLMIDDGSDISQIEGEYEVQRVNLSCLSDNPLIINIANS